MTVTDIRDWTKPRGECDGVSSQEILEANPGMTYRQLDYWVATKRVRCHLHALDGSTISYRDGQSSGYQRCYPPDQAAIAARMYRLVQLGIEVQAAYRIASDLQVSTRLFEELGRITREQWEEKA